MTSATNGAMNPLSEVLERFRAIGRLPFGLLSTPIDPADELRDLIEGTDRLEKDVRNTGRMPLSLMEDAKSRWRDARGRLDILTARHIRALCGESRIATDPVFVRGLAAQKEELISKRQWLERLAESYLAEWRTMRDPEKLETLLHQTFAGFKGRSARIQKYREVVHDLFSSHADVWLGKKIVDERRRVTDVLEEWLVTLSGGLGKAAVNAALDQWTIRFEQEKRNEILRSARYEWFDQLTKDLLDSPLLDNRRVGRAVSALILWDQAELDEKIHADLKKFILGDARFGDPRLPANANKWQSVDSKARQRMVAWLSRQDLLFFFNFVIDHDPHGRKDFWLRYIDQVEDSNVALSNADLRRLRANTTVKERMRYSRVMGGGNVSAFLMRFRGARDLIFVEFSEPGNALYIHDAERFQEVAGGIRSPKFHLSQQLKHQSKIAKEPHPEGWQATVQALLRRHRIRAT